MDKKDFCLFHEGYGLFEVVVDFGIQGVIYVNLVVMKILWKELTKIPPYNQDMSDFPLLKQQKVSRSINISNINPAV